MLREGPGANVASEETRTLIVNAHGALIQLALTVEVGQLLGIKNLQTMEQLVCRVVHLGAEQLGKREVGIEYENPSPRFWRITFPPSDRTPQSPEAKAPTKYVPGGRPPMKQPTARLRKRPAAPRFAFRRKQKKCIWGPRLRRTRLHSTGFF